MFKNCRSIPLVYQIILMVFALMGAVTAWRENGGFKGAELIKVLVLDQILYFVAYVPC